MDVNYEGEYEKIKSYGKYIGDYYASRINRPHLSKDFTQEFFACYYDPDIIKNAINSDGTIEMWLARFIAKRRLIDYIRSQYIDSPFNKNAKTRYVNDNEVNNIGMLGQPNNILETIITNEVCSDVEYLISKLSTKPRSAVRLVYLRGLTQEEASLEMGITESRVSQMLKAARIKLKRLATSPFPI